MKKFNYLLLWLVIGVITMSFSKALTKPVNANSNKIDELLLKIEFPKDADSQGWGSWNTTGCLVGLDFRVRNNGYNEYAKKYRWSIQFRNRYKKKIHFSYKAVAPNDRYDLIRSGKTTDRIHVKRNYGTRISNYLVKSSNSIYVYVNKIRIGAKDKGDDYYLCDK